MHDTLFTYDNLIRLLDRYEAGETTLEEERRLKAYFNQPAIDKQLRDWAPLFQALVVERTVVKPADETPLIVRKGGGYRYPIDGMPPPPLWRWSFLPGVC